MTNRIIVKYEQKPCYTIAFETSFDKLIEELEKIYNLSEKKICVVSDTNVYKLYGEEVVSILKSKAKVVTDFVFEAGETSKNLNTVKKLYEKLICDKFDRKDVLVALGGGVVGDLTGFAAATYLRGIDFVQVPTTLLSQVDSSIGGKTGVDFDSYKNMVGAFYQPKLVYANIKTFDTLSLRQFKSGMGEVIKHAFIKRKDQFDYLKENSVKILEEHDGDILTQMVYESCLVKKEVVERDPKEKGERALLNFGHTVGHAVEKLANFELYHGECVIIGVMAALYISYKRGNITIAEFRDAYRLITEDYKFSLQIPNIDSKEVLNVTKSDKKMENGKIKFILLKSIGEAYIDTTVTDEEILESIDVIKKNDWSFLNE